jgi:hypothetical protein
MSYKSTAEIARFASINSTIGCFGGNTFLTVRLIPIHSMAEAISARVLGATLMVVSAAVLVVVSSCR